MDTSNGRVYTQEEVEKMDPEKKARMVEITRDLTELEKSNKQIALYSPCACGSGKKFKFCCYKP